MDRKKAVCLSRPCDGRVKETSELWNARQSMTCPEEEAYVDTLRTTDLLSRGLTTILKGEGLSATQYNVLRILQGSPKASLV